MKFILAMNDEINGIELQFFNSKEELLKYLTEDEYSDWKLMQKKQKTKLNFGKNN